MLTTVIIGVDGRQGGRDALALGQVLAARTGASLIAVHVYPFEPVPLRGLRADLESVAREEAEELVHSEVDGANVAARTEVIAATSPGRGIHAAAEQLGADLIVIGPSHPGAVGRVVAGDSVRAVLQGSQRPVVIARPLAGGVADRQLVIGVGFDGEVDLLVLGSRGYGPVRRTLLGSTSDRVVHVAPSSVVVLPRGAA